MNRRLSLVAFAVLFVCSFVFLAPQAATAQSCAAWAPNTFYAVGATVTYGGAGYRCLQAHTSLVGWEPANVPALWTPQACSGTATPTPVRPTPTTATATPTSGTATPTSTPRPTNTPRSTPTNTPTGT